MYTGVHAARVVVSAKLLLAPEWLRPPSSSTSVGAETGEARRFPDLVDELNEQLPPEVRAFSCTRVNKGFQARDSCHWRWAKLVWSRLVCESHLNWFSLQGI